jgi:hypothetical protein
VAFDTKIVIDRLDNDPAIQTISFKNILVWPILRMQVLQYIIDTENQLDSPRTPEYTGIATKIAQLVKAVIRVPLLGPRKPVLFLNSALSTIKGKDGFYFNRVCDHFMELVREKAWMIEEPDNFRHPVPRRHAVYSRLAYSLYPELVARWAIKFASVKKKQAEICDRELRALIIRHLKELGFVRSAEGIRQKIYVRQILRVIPAFNMYKRLLKRKKIKILVIEDGHYGGDNALIILAAHLHKAKVFEPQHGFINQLHPAYNFGSMFRENEKLRDYYPDVLMTYGIFWGLGISIPGITAEVGNPQLELLAKVTGEKKKKILVLGSGVTVTETQELLEKLLKFNIEGYVIFYRPHPQELAGHAERYKQQYNKGVFIDSQELYSSLVESEIVIGELTTALFEALLLCNKVFLFKSRYTNAYYDSSIRYFTEFGLETVERVFDCTVSINNKDAIQYYWTEGYEQKFREQISA